MNPLRNPLRSILRSAARFLRQSRCKHVDTLRKTEGKRMFTECLRCEYQSNGVEIAGHDYASTKHSWEPAQIAAVNQQILALPPVAIAQEPALQVTFKPETHKYICNGTELPAVAIAPEPEYTSVDWGQQCTAFSITPVRRKSPRKPVAKAKRIAKKKPRKISAIKPRKTSRKPSSKRSKTA